MDELRLVDRVYDALLEEHEALPRLLADIGDCAGAYTAGLSLISPRERWGMSTIPRVDPELVSHHLVNWAKRDIAFDLLEVSATNHIGGLGAEDLALFKQSAAFQESWRRSGMGAQRRFAKLHDSRALSVVFTLHAGQADDEIAPDGEKLFAYLLPHISRASRLLNRQKQLHLELLSSGYKNAQDVVGVFFVGKGGLLVHADQYGEDMLRQEECFHLANLQYLSLRHAGSNERFQNAIQWCESVSNTPLESTIAIERDCDRRSLLVEVLPFPKGVPSGSFDLWTCRNCTAVVVVREPAKRRAYMIQKLRETYSLSHSEATLATEILKGDGRESAALRCGIALNTARAHLRSIYAKMNISRQSELIALVRDSCRF